ncbi:MAG: nucleotidyltransferase domain-containing protein [Firmicutes bacterium]|nr:nucleotidyltransferase domain-containing protein [Bacillota bacterium]
MLAAARVLAAALRRRGATRTLLFGSLARGPDAVGPTSDVDLVVVMPGVGGERMHRRLVDLPEVVGFPYALDLFVYTPEEWERVVKTAFVEREILTRGVVLT